MKMQSKVATLTVLACLVASSLFSYALLSPRRTWDSPPTLLAADRSMPTIADGDLGRTRIRNAIVASASWNGAGTGTRINASVGSVSSWRMAGGIQMLNFRDPVKACTGNCLAATFTGFFQSRGNGTNRITDADMVTHYNGFDCATDGGGRSGGTFASGALHTI